MVLTRRQLLKAVTAGGLIVLGSGAIGPLGAYNRALAVEFWEAVAICAVDAARKCKWLLRFPKLYGICWSIAFSRCMARLL